MGPEPSGGDRFGFGEAERKNAQALIELALREDLGNAGDITADATIPPQARGAAEFVARSEGVLAGLPVIALLAAHFEIAWGWQPLLYDGDALAPGAKIARIEGPMRALLALERTALNFLQRLSGIASLTARYVAAVAGTKAVILDTRKTTPGWRALEKYAVRRGGGQNHRIGLYDGILIKDNHLAWLAANPAESLETSLRAWLGQADAPLYPGDPIWQAVSIARARAPEETSIEVEVDTLTQLDRALACRPDIVLLDNFNPEQLAEAVHRRDAKAAHIPPEPGGGVAFDASGLSIPELLAESVRPRRQKPSYVLLEASGGITLASVRNIAETGIDRISVGALTHSAPALDIGLDFDEAATP